MATEEIENLYKELTTENVSAAAAPIFVEKSRDFYKSTEVSNLIVKTQQIHAKDEEKQQKWYAAGVKAKQRGYGDFSPFYKNATADYFFKCGYDNVPFVEAQQVLKDKIQQTLENNPIIKETVNELTRENTIDHLYVPEDQQ